MPAGLSITVCSSGEAARIAVIERECFGPSEGQSPWSEASIRSAIDSTGAHCLIATIGGADAGYAIAREIGAGEAELLRIAVRPASRRHGAARALIAELSSWLRRVGCSVVHLELRNTNAPALALYESTGFRRTGRRKSYFETGEDAILMAMELNRAGHAL